MDKKSILIKRLLIAKKVFLLIPVVLVVSIIILGPLFFVDNESEIFNSYLDTVPKIAIFSLVLALVSNIATNQMKKNNPDLFKNVTESQNVKSLSKVSLIIFITFFALLILIAMAMAGGTLI